MGICRGGEDFAGGKTSQLTVKLIIEWTIIPHKNGFFDSSISHAVS